MQDAPGAVTPATARIIQALVSTGGAKRNWRGYHGSWLRMGDRIVSFCRTGASLDYDYGDSDKKGRSLEK